MLFRKLQKNDRTKPLISTKITNLNSFMCFLSDVESSFNQAFEAPKYRTMKSQSNKGKKSTRIAKIAIMKYKNYTGIRTSTGTHRVPVVPPLAPQDGG